MATAVTTITTTAAAAIGTSQRGAGGRTVRRVIERAAFLRRGMRDGLEPVRPGGRCRTGMRGWGRSYEAFGECGQVHQRLCDRGRTMQWQVMSARHPQRPQSVSEQAVRSADRFAAGRVVAFGAVVGG